METVLKKIKTPFLVLLWVISNGVSVPLSAQIDSLSTDFVCPGDSILAMGEGFFGTDSVTVDGVRTFWTCAVDLDLNCAGNEDSMAIAIPWGVAYGGTVTLTRYEGGTTQSFTLDVCQGLRPDTACVGDEMSIYFDFSAPNTPDTVAINGTVYYDMDPISPEPPFDIERDSAIRFPAPAGLPEGAMATIVVDRGPTSATDLTYSYYARYEQGATFDYGQTNLCTCLLYTSPSPRDS